MYHEEFQIFPVQRSGMFCGYQLYFRIQEENLFHLTRGRIACVSCPNYTTVTWYILLSSWCNTAICDRRNHRIGLELIELMIRCTSMTVALFFSNHTNCLIAINCINWCWMCWEGIICSLRSVMPSRYFLIIYLGLSRNLYTHNPSPLFISLPPRS